MNIARDHRLTRMTVQQRELKKIRARDAIAMIGVVTAPGTVDDVDTTELSLKITSRSFPMVIQTPFTMMKAIIYLRRQQKVK